MTAIDPALLRRTRQVALSYAVRAPWADQADDLAGDLVSHAIEAFLRRGVGADHPEAYLTTAIRNRYIDMYPDPEGWTEAWQELASDPEDTPEEESPKAEVLLVSLDDLLLVLAAGERLLDVLPPTESTLRARLDALGPAISLAALLAEEEPEVLAGAGAWSQAVVETSAAEIHPGLSATLALHAAVWAAAEALASPDLAAGLSPALLREALAPSLLARIRRVLPEVRRTFSVPPPAPVFAGGAEPGLAVDLLTWHGEPGWSAFARFPPPSSAEDEARVTLRVHGAPGTAATAVLFGVARPLVRDAGELATAEYRLGDLRAGQVAEPDLPSLALVGAGGGEVWVGSEERH